MLYQTDRDKFRFMETFYVTCFQEKEITNAAGSSQYFAVYFLNRVC